MATGAELIVAERQRHFDVEGWTPEHDDQWIHGELAVAAACYAVHRLGLILVRKVWPWDRSWWKPTDEITDLKKAGALLAAEIDRLKRTEVVKPKVTNDGGEFTNRWIASPGSEWPIDRNTGSPGIPPPIR